MTGVIIGWAVGLVCGAWIKYRARLWNEKRATRIDR